MLRMRFDTRQQSRRRDRLACKNVWSRYFTRRRIDRRDSVVTHVRTRTRRRRGRTPPGLTHYRCYICHTDREPLVGPAFADVATFYRGKPGEVGKIATDIKAGVRGGGPWHMPPHPEITDAEARAMARYIMSLDEPKAAPLNVERTPAAPDPASSSRPRP